MNHEVLIPAASELIAPDGRVYHLGLTPDELAKNVFLVGDPARAKRVASFFDRIDHRVSNREYLTYTGTYKGLDISVIGTGIGTDNVEIAFVEGYILNEFDLDTQTRNPGCDEMTIIRLGTSGGVQPDVPAGTLAIAEYGLGLDSTGFYYELPVPDRVAIEIEIEASRLIDESIAEESRFKGSIKPYASKASEDVFNAIVDSAENNTFSYLSGITVSAPGFYGPSSRYIEGFSNSVPEIKLRLAELEVEGRRVLNMEMESSLLFHLAASIGYRAGTVCPIISNPLESDSLIDYGKVIDDTIAIGLDAILKLN